MSRRTLPTTKDVARLAGVSAATVSYVLNGRRQRSNTISAETRQRVLDAVTTLGYVPNQIGRSLRLQRTERVSLILPRIGVPVNDVLIRDIQRVADQHGYTVMISVVDTPERERHMLNQLKRRLADGAIIVHGTWAEEDFAELVQAGLPLVVQRNHVTAEGFDVVQTTEAETCYEAVSYLLCKGHRRIAFLGHFENLPSRLEHYDRFTSYLQALKDHNIAIDERLICAGATTRNDAYQSALDLLRLQEPPSAIFAASDIAAVSAIWAAHSIGLRIPEDLALIGAGNIPEGEITDPPITTVGPADLDFTAIADLLFSRLANPEQEGRVYQLQWQLILRASA
ncbi:LacI family DNA-binding transcriptional regulator [Reticulibacter mediterranei]|nr:LacI family DNA-binding transcriptional regulator [Reticulibacter mediterranei]